MQETKDVQIASHGVTRCNDLFAHDSTAQASGFQMTCLPFSQCLQNKDARPGATSLLSLQPLLRDRIRHFEVGEDVNLRVRDRRARRELDFDNPPSIRSPSTIFKVFVFITSLLSRISHAWEIR